MVVVPLEPPLLTLRPDTKQTSKVSIGQTSTDEHVGEYATVDDARVRGRLPRQTMFDMPVDVGDVDASPSKPPLRSRATAVLYEIPVLGPEPPALVNTVPATAAPNPQDTSAYAVPQPRRTPVGSKTSLDMATRPLPPPPLDPEAASVNNNNTTSRPISAASGQHRPLSGAEKEAVYGRLLDRVRSRRQSALHAAHEGVYAHLQGQRRVSLVDAPDMALDTDNTLMGEYSLGEVITEPPSAMARATSDNSAHVPRHPRQQSHARQSSHHRASRKAPRRASKRHSIDSPLLTLTAPSTDDVMTGRVHAQHDAAVLRSLESDVSSELQYDDDQFTDEEFDLAEPTDSHAASPILDRAASVRAAIIQFERKQSAGSDARTPSPSPLRPSHAPAHVGAGLHHLNGGSAHHSAGVVRASLRRPVVVVPRQSIPEVTPPASPLAPKVCLIKMHQSIHAILIL